MTTVVNRHEPSYAIWSSMPGWGIVADLTPPELVEARKLAVLRKIIGGALIAVLLLCAGGVVLAHQKKSSAENSLAAANDRSTAVTAKRGRYSVVTRVEAATKAASAQQTGLMATDVDILALTQKIGAAAPPGISMSSVAITLVPVTSGTATPNATGVETVGSVNMTGSARKFNDVADFVRQLNATSGFTGVIPTSNATDKDAAPAKKTQKASDASTWTITFGLTNSIYSKRFNPVTTGSQDATTTAQPTGGK